MPRAIWSGAISFGLVNIPVKLYSAVSRKTVRFHQLDSEDNQRIQQKRVNPRTGEEVPYENLVKGYELAPDRYVVITPEELESLEPQKYRDEYRDRVLEMIERKAEGQEVVVEAPEEEPQKVPDLMAALEASIAGAKKQS